MSGHNEHHTPPPVVETPQPHETETRQNFTPFDYFKDRLEAIHNAGVKTVKRLTQEQIDAIKKGKKLRIDPDFQLQQDDGKRADILPIENFTLTPEYDKDFVTNEEYEKTVDPDGHERGYQNYDRQGPGRIITIESMRTLAMRNGRASQDTTDSRVPAIVRRMQEYNEHHPDSPIVIEGLPIIQPKTPENILLEKDALVRQRRVLLLSDVIDNKPPGMIEYAKEQYEVAQKDAFAQWFEVNKVAFVDQFKQITEGRFSDTGVVQDVINNFNQLVDIAGYDGTAGFNYRAMSILDILYNSKNDSSDPQALELYQKFKDEIIQLTDGRVLEDDLINKTLAEIRDSEHANVEIFQLVDQHGHDIHPNDADPARTTIRRINSVGIYKKYPPTQLPFNEILAHVTGTYDTPPEPPAPFERPDGEPVAPPAALTTEPITPAATAESVVVIPPGEREENQRPPEPIPTDYRSTELRKLEESLVRVSDENLRQEILRLADQMIILPDDFKDIDMNDADAVRARYDELKKYHDEREGQRDFHWKPTELTRSMKQSPNRDAIYLPPEVQVTLVEFQPALQALRRGSPEDADLADQIEQDIRDGVDFIPNLLQPYIGDPEKIKEIYSADMTQRILKLTRQAMDEGRWTKEPTVSSEEVIEPAETIEAIIPEINEFEEMIERKEITPEDLTLFSEHFSELLTAEPSKDEIYLTSRNQEVAQHARQLKNIEHALFAMEDLPFDRGEVPLVAAQLAILMKADGVDLNNISDINQDWQRMLKLLARLNTEVNS